MTDSRYVANPSPNSNQPAGATGSSGPTGPQLHVQTQPVEPEPERRSGVSTVQVGASAAAAVTSAFAASFFGVAGTLIGAAVGSVVSTVAGALYVDYLGRAGQRIRVVTKDVVIQRVPADVRAGTPLRHLTGPTALPGSATLRPVGAEPGDESVTVPLEGVDELRAQPAGMAPLMPAGRATGAGDLPSAARSGAARQGGSARGRRRPVLAAAMVALAGFAIAIGAVLTTETAIGRPVSGGTGGNTFTELVNGSSDATGSDTSDPEVTPSEVATADPAATPTATGTTATVEPGAGGDAEVPGTPAATPSSTADPSAGDAVEPTTAAEPTSAAESTEVP